MRTNPALLVPVLLAGASVILLADQKEQTPAPISAKVIDDSRNRRLSVRGYAALPDGTSLFVRLMFAGRVVLWQEVFVRSRRFAAALDLSSKALSSGTYTVEIRFHPDTQHPKLRPHLRNAKPLRVEHKVFLGSPEDRLKQVEQERRYFLKAHGTLTGQYDEFMALYRPWAPDKKRVGKSIGGKAGRGGQVITQKAGLMGDAGDAGTRAPKTPKKGQPGKDSFDPQDYFRRYLRWEQKLRQAEQEMERYRERYTTPQFPQAAETLLNLAYNLRELAQGYSRELYQLRGYRVPLALRHISRAGDLVKPEQYASMVRSLAKRIFIDLGLHSQELAERIHLLKAHRRYGKLQQELTDQLKEFEKQVSFAAPDWRRWHRGWRLAVEEQQADDNDADGIFKEHRTAIKELRHISIQIYKRGYAEGYALLKQKKQKLEGEYADLPEDERNPRPLKAEVDRALKALHARYRLAQIQDKLPRPK